MFLKNRPGRLKQPGAATRLYSEIGFGTAVSLHLPLANGQTDEIPELEPAETLKRLGGMALLVNDETDLLDIAQGLSR